MTRTWAALTASAVAIVVLLALIYTSRPIGTQAYAAHHSQLNKIDSSVVGYTAMMDQLRSARRSTSSVGNTIIPLRSRLEKDRQSIVESMTGNEAVKPLLRTYEASVDKLVADSYTAEEQLRRFEQSMKILREEGPVAVQSLRSANSGPNPQRFYSLLLKTLEFSQPGSNVDPTSITKQVVALRNGARVLPTYLLDIAAAVDSIIALRDPLDASLTSVEQSNFVAAAQALRGQLSAAHNQRVRERDNARILVSVYSLLLFAGLGFLGVRLHRSYRDLNDVNNQLKMSNDVLEQRVEERTRDVQKAYDDLQHSQVQLVQAEKMSSLGQLVAGISHEINTPLLYLQSNATLNKETLGRISTFIDECHDKLLPKLQDGETREDAKQRFLAGLKELQHSLLDDEIREELNEVLALTDDNLEGLEELTVLAQGLKDFSRLDRAPVDSFNVNDGVTRTLTIAKNMLKTRINVETRLGNVPEISCAPSQINQVLLNIITNAAQAIEGEGEIVITTESRGGEVAIEIRDNGCGIPREILQKIRDPFFTTKEVGSGTGLGLSIVEEILGKHGGRLDIQSEEGTGSTFTIFLPVGTRAQDLEGAFEPPSQAQAAPPGPPATVSPAPSVASRPARRIEPALEPAPAGAAQPLDHGSTLPMEKAAELALMPD